MELYFTELVIIQSLQPGDAETGTQLYEHLKSVETLPVPVRLVNVATAAQMFAVFEECRRLTVGSNYVPIIHLDIHGAASKAGLVMASREFVDWIKVSQHLRELNIATRNSLVVVLGVCSGAFIMTAAANNPFEPTPFRGIVGPDKPVLDFFLPHGFRAFYLTLAKTGDFKKALHELRERTLPEYMAMDTSTMFKIGMQHYEKNFLRGEILKKRVKKILRRQSRQDVVSAGGRNKARAQIASQLRDLSQRRLDYYNHFIMADIYPENATRLPPLDDV